GESVAERGQASGAGELKVARAATVVLGVAAVLLGITFKGQNVAFMVSLAFAIAASGNFPALLLAIFWRRFSTAGAVASMLTGTFGTLLLIWLSPTVQVDLLHRASAFFPLKNPSRATTPLSFVVGIAVSLLSAPRGASDFALHERQMHMGTAGD